MSTPSLPRDPPRANRPISDLTDPLQAKTPRDPRLHADTADGPSMTGTSNVPGPWEVMTIERVPATHRKGDLNPCASPWVSPEFDLGSELVGQLGHSLETLIGYNFTVNAHRNPRCRVGASRRHDGRGRGVRATAANYVPRRRPPMGGCSAHDAMDFGDRHLGLAHVGHVEASCCSNLAHRWHKR